MEADQTKNFLEAIQGAAQILIHHSIRKATIVHHNDADGIASGAILKKALQRQGFLTENIPIERIHPLLLPKIHRADRKLILYADLGGQAASMISQNILKDTSVMILDHHPPFQSTFSNLPHINPEIFGIDGDLSSSAATVAFLFALALNVANEDLAYLGVIGAIGDSQMVEGRLIGLNQISLAVAERKGMIYRASDESIDPYRFTLFKGERGMEVTGSISDLAVNGYYRGGAELAIQICLKGHTDQSKRIASEMRKIQEDLFEKEKERLQLHRIFYEGDIQWVDVEDRFYPLSLKAIGLFCAEISKTEGIHGDKYIVGFQNIPNEIPSLGRFEWKETKASMRVPAALHREIEKGLKPDLTEILPKAAEEVGGFAEGCHRYAAACTIPKNKKMALIRSLTRIVKIPPFE
jgi:single-stranded-DNA-specific exonuclease